MDLDESFLLVKSRTFIEMRRVEGWFKNGFFLVAGLGETVREIGAGKRV